jgi:hypothetical protein
MRQRLYFVIVVLIAAGLGGGCRNSERFSKTAKVDREITGAWRTRVQFGSGALAATKDLEFMYVFNAGGTMTESSNYDAAPPVPPAYGVWRGIGGNQFEAKYEFSLTRVPDTSEHLPTGSGWLPAGHGVLSEIIRLSDSGKAYTSSIRYEIYDQSGTRVQDRGEGSGEGVRVEF